MKSLTLTLTLTALLLSATAAFPVDSEDDTPPKPAQTSQECTGAQVWNDAEKACTDAKESRLDDDTRYRAVRELAYAGQYDRALLVIAAADDAQDPRFLNYRGFIARKQGDMESALVWYRSALAVDPDHILARSYMGLGLVEIGDIEGAQAQLAEIRARGGRDTWAYVALKQALSGKSSTY